MAPLYIGTLIKHLSFPESPRWHDESLWFSDFYQHKVFRVGSGGGLLAVADVPQQPSGLGWLPDGDLLVVSMLDRRVLRVAGDGAVSTHADLSGLVSAPCNDMVVAADGTAYVGNFGFDRHKGEPQATTVLARVAADGAVTIAADSLLFPNGGALSRDGKLLYLAESFANQVSRFDVAGDGALTGRRVFHHAQGFFPDGLCLHETLGVYAADPVSRRVRHIDLQGRLVGEYSLPQDRLPIACAIGGENNNTLFVASNTGLGPGMAAERNGRIEMFLLDGTSSNTAHERQP